MKKYSLAQLIVLCEVATAVYMLSMGAPDSIDTCVVLYRLKMRGEKEQLKGRMLLGGS